MVSDDPIDEMIDREFSGETNFPTIQYMIGKYANNVDNNDAKAVHLFCYYEGLEKIRALQRELYLIKTGGSANFALDRLCGPRRKQGAQDYIKWAQKLLILVSKQQL